MGFGGGCGVGAPDLDGKALKIDPVAGSRVLARCPALYLHEVYVHVGLE